MKVCPGELSYNNIINMKVQILYGLPWKPKVFKITLFFTTKAMIFLAFTITIDRF